VTDLRYRIYYLSVIASGLFLKIKAREEITSSTRRQLCVLCAVTDDNQTLATHLGYRLGYPFDIASGLFLKIKALEETTRSIRRQLRVRCAVTGENQTLVTDFVYLFGYLFIIVSVLFLRITSGADFLLRRPPYLDTGLEQFPIPLSPYKHPRGHFHCASIGQMLW
jgi:hypothetical protein